MSDPPLTRAQRAYLDEFDRYLRSTDAVASTAARRAMDARLVAVVDEAGVAHKAWRRLP